MRQLCLAAACLTLPAIATGIGAQTGRPANAGATAGASQPSGPGPRSQPALVFDSRRGRLLLLDGTYPAVQRERAEVWTWDGARWELLDARGPEPRHASAAVYDSQRGVVVVFGGRTGRQERVGGDTWELGAEGWRQREDTTPGRRDHHAMAYDARRGRTVMFGGGRWPREPGPWATDTWEWDGSRWTRVATAGPIGRVAPLVYDAARGVTVLFGGVGRAESPGREQPSFGDTWSWDGAEWRRVAGEGAGPSPRNRHAMSFDSRAGVVLLYGGSLGRDRQFADMWRWDGRSWSPIPLSGETPGPRELHAMAYDPLRDRTVLFGGNSGGRVLDDVWEWDGQRWRRVR